MGDSVEAEISSLKVMLGAGSDSELAALLGLRRSAISQWKKRGNVPDRAREQARKVLASRDHDALSVSAVARLPDTLRQFSRALAIDFVARYTATGDAADPEKLLRWAASFDETVFAASVLLRNRCEVTGEELGECYLHTLQSQFFIQDLIETLVHPHLVRRAVGVEPTRVAAKGR